MKAILFLLMGYALNATAQVIHLRPGDVFVFKFSGFNESFSAASRPFAMVEVGFTSGLPGFLSAGDMLKIEMFENSLTDPVLSVATIGAGGDDFYIGAGLAKFDTDAWRDAQGAVRLTMVEGSVDIGSLVFTVSDGRTWFRNVTPVPEPPVMALFSGMLALAWLVRRMRTTRSN